MSALSSQYSDEEIGRIGEEIYRQRIRSQVLPEHKGEFLVLDIETGDYEIGVDDLQTERRMRARHPDGVLYGLRIGYASAYKIGGTMLEDRP